MPKAKKPSAFMCFAKERYPNLPINAAVSKAGKEWEVMSKEKKEKYAEKCKTITLDAKPRELLTSQGIPLSLVEKEQQEVKKKEYSMKTEIEDIVISGRDAENLTGITFNFVSVNYFSKTTDESIYTPAEIAFSVYSLKDGIKNRYHSLINPNAVPYGHAFETKQHSEATHQLGVPPDVQGEKNLEKLYLDCLEFLSKNNKCVSEYPPLFTHQDVKVVESVLQYMRMDCNEEVTLRVYPLRDLFYMLKMTTSEIGETKPPESKFITNAYLDKDIYEYQTDIACNFHEMKDCAKYCALSCVTRWAFTLSDHLCKDLALEMEVGHHVPKNADLTMSYSFCESNFDSSVITQPKVEREHFNLSETTSFSSVEHFPSISDSKKRKNLKAIDMDATMTTISNGDDNDKKSSNPWNRQKLSRPPAEESFSFDISEYEEFVRKPASSGRGLLFNKIPEQTKISRGRGLSFGD